MGSSISDRESLLRGVALDHPSASYGEYRRLLGERGLAFGSDEGVRRAMRDFTDLATRDARVAYAARDMLLETVGYDRSDLAEMVSTKKEGHFNWREFNKPVMEMQRQIHEASNSQDEGVIGFPEATDPICLIAISDWHWGSWGTDYAAIERITDEILGIPGLYFCCLSDMEQMSIKFRSVLEMSDNAFPPKIQHYYTRSWLEEVAQKALFFTWDNHSVMRSENGEGSSPYADIVSRRVMYFNGIGHADIVVGDQVYKAAVSHFFRGRSMLNPLHSQMRYMRFEAPERELCMAGDSHVPAFMKYYESGKPRVALNTGTLQMNSGYAKRFFSLKSWPIFPCVELDPRTHRMTPYESVSEWGIATGRFDLRELEEVA